MQFHNQTIQTIVLTDLRCRPFYGDRLVHRVLAVLPEDRWVAMTINRIAPVLNLEYGAEEDSVLTH